MNATSISADDIADDVGDLCRTERTMLRRELVGPFEGTTIVVYPRLLWAQDFRQDEEAGFMSMGGAA